MLSLIYLVVDRNIYKHQYIHIYMTDNRTRYSKITTILTPIVGKTLHKDKLLRRIMIDIGSSRGVVRETFQSMIDLGLVREVKENHYLVERCEADI